MIGDESEKGRTTSRKSKFAQKEVVERHLPKIGASLRLQADDGGPRLHQLKVAANPKSE